MIGMTMKRIVFLLHLAVIFFQPWCLSQAGESMAIPAPQPAKLMLAAEDSWPPFADDQGHGLSHRLIAAALGRRGIRVESLVVPYQRAMMMAEKGNVDGVFNVARQGSTQTRFVFGERPLFTASASFYHKMDKRLAAKDKWSLPKGTMIGIISGYEYGDELAKLTQLQLVKVDNQQQLINLLLIGRIHGAIMYDAVAREQLQLMGVADEIVPAFANHSSDIFLAFSKQNPAAKTLAQQLDLGLTELQQNGEYDKLLAQLGPLGRP
ncbi:amino acid ABC transporter substrate-binding protein [Shewanella sp. SHSM-M6]|uniref:Amino acid ABC transporter substrate-binding protein n=2 Tax=Shewanella salipaludis TaxID=2723052 RepID=A0A972FWJ9_9GAMM|nr:transporter substrate-binding domain-containing protein [Shewanella salipaludis]NMH66574.1 amino acid ABC transporter substrate-binding protein [Shewanella salipaludis]